ncbi:MAG TPA: SIMPL domain-containing protein, partial [Gemmatimonadaceae bacterium]|nr:SIMPL domain-containing protein [Gemmatimonadaceae bacterium]
MLRIASPDIRRPARRGARRTAIIVASAAAMATAMAGAVVSPLAAQTPSVPAGNVSASGSASITVEPDLALDTIQYSAAGRTPALAGRAAARRANAIRAAIIAVGIPADSLPTTGSQGWWWGSWGDRSSIQVRNDMKDTSYVTNDAFLVRIHDLKLVGRVIDTALT